ncbi:hypothetical protein MANES_10G141850v8 [Manihot esculenta]|uniref:Uncharacterized protein n=1 Tax=Manihot esculenta TaxID=3983 RepID=A0ACB7H2A7_MANES|nr:hypothetical protein MANES_10G141850v8 [Manihot esculenta]
MTHLETKCNLICGRKEVAYLPNHSSLTFNLPSQPFSCYIIKQVICIIDNLSKPPYPVLHCKAFLLLLLSIHKYCFDGGESSLKLPKILFEAMHQTNFFRSN